MPETTFTSDGKAHKITVYPGRADGKKYPILLLLHGNLGLGEPYGTQIRGFAESLAGIRYSIPVLGETLAGLGYVTAVPQYFLDDDEHPNEQNPTPYLPTLEAAIQYVGSQHDADPNRVGLIGYSLGAAIAMTHIATNPPGKIKALVDYFGPVKPFGSSTPIQSPISTGIGSFPPTITFHDAKDRIVPVGGSLELHGLISGVDHELHVYVAEPPGLTNHAFKPDGDADVTSRNEATRWLLKHLPPTAL